MARAIWTGSLSFGLVNVPVGLYSATEDHTVHFHQFQKGTSSRVRYKRVNEDTGEEVDYDDIVKGAEVGDDEYVIVTPEELEEVEPGRSRTIDISDFVDVAEIDPIFYEKTYYLAPQDEASGKAYGLLLAAMEKADRVGIATFVMRSKQYLAAIRPQNEVLTLETMFFADEIRDPIEEIDELPVKRPRSSKDLDLAVSLIESMTTPWEPENYRDTYMERVEQLIEAKRNNEEIVTEHEPVEEGRVVDLMEALQASLDKARDHKPGNAKQAEQSVQKTSARTKKESAASAKGESKGRSKSESAGEDLGELSKEELYELAQELDIPGRSKMNRKKLEQAVGDARGGKKAS